MYLVAIASLQFESTGYNVDYSKKKQKTFYFNDILNVFKYRMAVVKSIHVLHNSAVIIYYSIPLKYRDSLKPVLGGQYNLLIAMQSYE